MSRINLIIIEGVLIILLVLFAGFLVYQNQALTRKIQELSALTVAPTPTISPSPSPTMSPSPSPKSAVSPKPTVSPSPINISVP